MPHASFDADTDPTPFIDQEFIQYLEDHEFDLIFPDRVQNLSRVHWTPISVARMAARFLVAKPQTRVLDIGCGPGKFCAVGASTTEGHFTGVEQRANLVRAGEDMVRRYGLQRVQFIHGNMTEVRFGDFDAFYLFNPFEENLWNSLRIDSNVVTEPQLYNEYAAHVSRELARQPPGTRVVTYWGDGDEVPGCYECMEMACGDQLKMWVKMRSETSQATSVPTTAGLGEGHISTSAFAAL